MTQARAQTSFDEELIEDPGVVEAMETWAKKNRQHLAVKHIADEAKEEAEGLVTKLELKNGKYRAGGVVITIKDKEVKDVEYTTKAGRQMSFSDKTPKD